ncbi:MAG: rRNA cytosine-C5-methylase [Micropruina sp.]|nr:rRNA cytosine-C5-methylase [Micropruina sp.]
MKSRRATDPARRVAYRVLRAVSADGAYANLELAKQLREANLGERDAAFVTELVSGTCRFTGTYDLILARASGRPLSSMQPAVIDILRLGCHQLLSMRVPSHAAISATVDLAAKAVGERVTGLVNAVLRKVAAHELDEWLAELTSKLSNADALAVRSHHPRWIADAFAELLPADEVVGALAASNRPPQTHLVVRPGLADPRDLPGEPLRYSPFGTVVDGNPGDVPALRQGRAGVQDEGSQLVALALSRVDVPDGPWLDLCAGPGGKAALLAGLALQQGHTFLASELQPHRAELVAQALRKYSPRPLTIAADGTKPAWRAGVFARVMADVPCTGLGALRRRPEARWRRKASDLEELIPLQRSLLRSAIDAAASGGVIAYVTCSPHRRETSEVVEAVAADAPVEIMDAAQYLPEVPDCAVGSFVQLWPHRHGTDAMFLALLRKRG